MDSSQGLPGSGSIGTALRFDGCAGHARSVAWADTGSFVRAFLRCAGVKPFDTTSSAGVGMTSESLQYHGTVDAYELSGATALVSLWDDLTTPSAMPAVSHHSAGAG